MATSFYGVVQIPKMSYHRFSLISIVDILEVLPDGREFIQAVVDTMDSPS